MKKNIYTIFCAWALLICFVAGQYMVYAHQHAFFQKANTTTVAKNQPKPAVTVQEKCYMCDVMHHTAMFIDHQVYYFPIVVKGHIYKTGDYNFTAIALVLSAGRAPPVIS